MTCAEELPQIETQLLPTYGAQGLDAVAVNTSRNTTFAAQVALDKGITFPIALDVESEVFRYYRVPGRVFPLNVVIDREGRIAHVDNGPGLDAAEAAIVSALMP